MTIKRYYANYYNDDNKTTNISNYNCVLLSTCNKVSIILVACSCCFCITWTVLSNAATRDFNSSIIEESFGGGTTLVEGSFVFSAGGWDNSNGPS